MKENLTNKFSLLAIFCIPLYLVRVSLFGIPSNVFEIIALLVVLASLNITFFKEITKLPSLLKIGIFLLFTGIITSILFNDSQLVELGILKSWFVIPVLFSFAIYINLKSVSDIEKLFKSAYFSSASVGFVGILYKLFTVTTYDNRLSGFYLSPNYLAMYLAPGLLFGVYFLIISFSKRHWKAFCLHAVLLSMILIPLYLTFSYGAWLAALLSVFFFINLILRPSKKIFFAFVLLLITLISLLFFSQSSSDKLSSIIDLSPRSSLESRRMIWQVSLLLVRENLFIGIGPGNFQSAYISQQPKFKPYLEWAVPQPHNIFLAFWLQTGLFGFIGFLLLLFFISHVLYKSLRNKKNTAIAAILAGFFSYVILHGLIDTTYWKNDLSVLFWLCTFASLFLYKNNYKPKDK